MLFIYNDVFIKKKVFRVMNNSFAFFDILIFAIIAVLLVYRLQGILGKKGGLGTKINKPKQKIATGKTIDGRDLEKNGKKTIDEGESQPGINKIQNLIQQIHYIDPSFDQNLFLQGAGKAFEIIVSSFASGDKKKLRSLLGNSIYQNFVNLLDERNKKNLTLKTDIISLQNPVITDVSLNLNLAKITVRFSSQQISYTMQGGKKTTSQDSEKVIDVIDEWIFSRDLKSQNPNWTLIETN